MGLEFGVFIGTEPKPVRSKDASVPVELEQRAHKLSFMFEQMAKIRALEGSVHVSEIQGLNKYTSEHQDIILSSGANAWDIDHTLAHDPRLLVSEKQTNGTLTRTGVINGENLPKQEQEIFQMIAVLALAGKPQYLLTGRDLYAHPTAWYVQQQMQEFAEVASELHRYEDDRGIDFQWYSIDEDYVYRPSTVRPSTIDGNKPAVLLVGSSNGVELRDVWDGYKRVGTEYVIPDSFWEALANDDEIYELLLDSSDPKRLQQMTQAFRISDADGVDGIEGVKNKLRRFMNVSYNGGKANLMFEVHQIEHNEKNLQTRWFDKTGIMITPDHPESFMQALTVLFKQKFGEDESQWPFDTTRAISNGQRVLDVIPKNVNKGKALHDIQQYMASRYGEYYHQSAILTAGDNHLPGANDNKMLQDIPGSVSCSGDKNHGLIPGSQWPILLRDLPGMTDNDYIDADPKSQKDYSVTLTHKYLQDLVLFAAKRRYIYLQAA